MEEGCDILMRKRKIRKEMIEIDRKLDHIWDITNWSKYHIWGITNWSKSKSCTVPTSTIYRYSYHIKSPTENELLWSEGRYEIIQMRTPHGSRYDVRYLYITHYAETHIAMAELYDIIGTDLESLYEATSIVVEHYRERLENERSIYEHS